MSQPQISMPSTKDTAEGLARLDPTDSALFILGIVVFALLAERIIAGWRMMKERESMAAISKEFAASAREFSHSTQAVILKIEVLSALAARLEAPRSPNDDRAG